MYLMTYSVHQLNAGLGHYRLHRGQLITPLTENGCAVYPFHSLEVAGQEVRHLLEAHALAVGVACLVVPVVRLR